MSSTHPPYETARGHLIAYLHEQGYRVHPNEVFCPSGRHCWVDVAAVKGSDYWAFEYKSRSDSIRRGFDQCSSYANGFNYVVLVADRHRVTSSPYFPSFMSKGFGVWRHDRLGFRQILQPKRHTALTEVKRTVERQFRHLHESTERSVTPLSRWLQDPSVSFTENS
jgi:hypothetical protein